MHPNQTHPPRRRSTRRSTLRRLPLGLPLALLTLLSLGVMTLAPTRALAQENTDTQAVEQPTDAIERNAEAGLENANQSLNDTTLDVAATADAAGQAGTSALEAAGVTAGQYRANNLWVLIATALVFIMHLGFCSVESGLCRAKNAVNILTKNVWIVCVGILTYWVWGFNSMYPGDAWLWDGVFAIGSPLNPMSDPANLTPGYHGGAYTIYTDFIFQAMFAATAATIVSGAVAERIKLAPFMVFAVVIVLFAYPFTGSWKWGGGWLEAKGFYDFAGSTLVHAFGGWAALAGVLLLGPRIGKFAANGTPRAIPGHNIPLANIGVFLLFLGWFGFNGGSILSAAESTPGTPGVDFVFVTTTLAGVAGGVVALLTSWTTAGKPDLTMGLNGILAGLVGITAGANVISPGWSIVVGAVAGLIVVLAVLGFDRIRIDDPVGAISVHGVCGIWGTLAVGIFGNAAYLGTNDAGVAYGGFGIQVLGTLVVSVTAFLISLSIFGILKILGGIRVSEAEEIEGLDLGEHGMSAYHDLTPGTAA